MISGHSTYWQIKERPYPSKRYVLIFDKYRNYDGKNPSITEYDNLDELHEETKLLNEYYKDTPRPVVEKKDIEQQQHIVFLVMHIFGDILF